MSTLSCFCSNVSITTTKKTFPIPQLKWENPFTGSGKVVCKYTALTHSSQVLNWSFLHCDCCGVDVCLINGNDIIVNPELTKIPLNREKLTYSQTYGLYVDLTNVQSRPSTSQSNIVNSLSLGSINRDPVEKELLSIKQQRIDRLFQEKEQRIREFVMEQEEAYETERRQVGIECDAIRSNIDTHIHEEIPKITVTPNKQNIKNHLVIYLIWMKISVVYDDITSGYSKSFNVQGNDDLDNSPIEPRLTKSFFETTSSFEEPFVSKAQNIKKVNKKPTKYDFPSTFKEYTINSITNSSEALPISSSYVTNKSQF
ncbi:Uncharacterized protein QTN25_002674 [Entamoeba marina]